MNIPSQSVVTLKSSREWAPLLSFLASAATMVWRALTIRFCNSRVSTRSVFQIIPLSDNCGKKNNNENSNKMFRMILKQHKVNVYLIIKFRSAWFVYPAKRCCIFWNSLLRHFMKITASYFCFWTKLMLHFFLFFMKYDNNSCWLSVYLNIIHFFVNSIHLVYSFLQCWSVSENSRVVLHCLYNNKNTFTWWSSPFMLLSYMHF